MCLGRSTGSFISCLHKAKAIMNNWHSLKDISPPKRKLTLKPRFENDCAELALVYLNVCWKNVNETVPCKLEGVDVGRGEGWTCGHTWLTDLLFLCHVKHRHVQVFLFFFRGILKQITRHAWTGKKWQNNSFAPNNWKLKTKQIVN